MRGGDDGVRLRLRHPRRVARRVMMPAFLRARPRRLVGLVPKKRGDGRRVRAVSGGGVGDHRSHRPGVHLEVYPEVNRGVRGGGGGGGDDALGIRGGGGGGGARRVGHARRRREHRRARLRGGLFVGGGVFVRRFERRLVERRPSRRPPRVGAASVEGAAVAAAARFGRRRRERGGDLRDGGGGEDGMRGRLRVRDDLRRGGYPAAGVVGSVLERLVRRVASVAERGGRGDDGGGGGFARLAGDRLRGDPVGFRLGQTRAFHELDFSPRLLRLEREQVHARGGSRAPEVIHRGEQHLLHPERVPLAPVMAAIGPVRRRGGLLRRGLVDVGFVVVFVAAVGGAADDPLLPAAFVGYGLDLGFRGLDLGFRGLGFDVLLRLLLLPPLLNRSVLALLVLVVRKLPEHNAVSVARPRLAPAHHRGGPFELPRHPSHPARELLQHVDQRPERQADSAHGADGGTPHALVRRVDHLGRRRRDVQQEVLRLDQPAGGDEARASVDVDGQVLLLDVESLVVQRPGEGDLGFGPRPGLHLRLPAQPVQRGQSPVDAHGVLASRGANHPPGPALRQRLLAVVDELAGDGDLPLQVSRVLEEVQQHVIEGLLHPVVVRPRRPVPHDRRRGLRVRTHLLQDAHQVFERALRRFTLRLNLLNHQVARLREVLEGELRVFRARVGGGRAGPRAREAAAGRRAKR